MRGFYWRGEKYYAKMANNALGEIYSSNVEKMASSWRQKTSPFYFLEAKVRGYLLDNNIKTTKFPFYLSFAKKALMFYQNYSGIALTERLAQLVEIFKAYGLQETHLKNIIQKILHRTPVSQP